MPADCGWATAHQSTTTQFLTRGGQTISSDDRPFDRSFRFGLVQHVKSAAFAYEKAPRSRSGTAWLSARVIPRSHNRRGRGRYHGVLWCHAMLEPYTLVGEYPPARQTRPSPMT